MSREARATERCLRRLDRNLAEGVIAVQKKAGPGLPAGAPPGADVRYASEVPVGAWIAPLDESMNPGAWRPTVDRAGAREYTVLFHEKPSAGKAPDASKFPHGVLVAWCRTRPTFPDPAEGVRS